MAMVTSELKAGDAPSEEVIARVREGARYPVTFDEDCHELTDEELGEFRPVNPELRLNPEFFRPEKAHKAEG